MTELPAGDPGHWVWTNPEGFEIALGADGEVESRDESRLSCDAASRASASHP
jgi:hypothetical protein